MLNLDDKYEIRIKVKTLADVSKILMMLDKAGYRDVEVGPPLPRFPIEVIKRTAEVMRGRFNEAILKALYELRAADKESAVDVEKIIEQMGKNRDFAELLKCTPLGVLKRTVTMIASAILADKYGLVIYDDKQTPKKFWLTKKGLEQIAKKPDNYLIRWERG